MKIAAKNSTSSLFRCPRWANPPPRGFRAKPLPFKAQTKFIHPFDLRCSLDTHHATFDHDPRAPNTYPVLVTNISKGIMEGEIHSHYRRDGEASELVRAPTASVAYQRRDWPHPLRLQSGHYRGVVHSQILLRSSTPQKTREERAGWGSFKRGKGAQKADRTTTLAWCSFLFGTHTQTFEDSCKWCSWEREGVSEAGASCCFSSVAICRLVSCVRFIPLHLIQTHEGAFTLVSFPSNID